MRERRYKVFYLSPELLLDANMGGKITPTLDYPVAEFVSNDLPEGFEIDDVAYLSDRRVFRFHVWHKDWNIVPECHPIPELTVNCTRHRVPVIAKISSRVTMPFENAKSVDVSWESEPFEAADRDATSLPGIGVVAYARQLADAEIDANVSPARDEPPAEKKINFREFF